MGQATPPSLFPDGVYIVIIFLLFHIYVYVNNLMVEIAACMSQNLLLKLIWSLFFIIDGKSAAFVPQSSNGVMDGQTKKQTD
jgi:hypothetical protein